jgi:hypothetical protein
MDRIGTVSVRAFAALILAAASWLFLPFPGTTDVGAFWLPWMRNVDVHGIVEGYAANAGDYPPGCSVVLLAADRLGRAFGAGDFTALKWSLLVVLCGSSLLVWLWTRSVALAVACHLALLPQTLALGYVDVYVAPWLIAALWALAAGRPMIFSLCFAAACLTKWQPLILTPFLLVHALGLRDLRPWRTSGFSRTALRVIAPGAALTLLTAAIFGAPMLRALQRALGHELLSGYALNFPWIVTHWLRAYRPDAFGGLTDGQADLIMTAALQYTLLPKVLFLGFYATAVVLALRRPKTMANGLRFALLGYLAYFTFNTGVHENHLFPAVILAVMLYWHDRSQAATAAAIALLSNVNLVLFYGVDGTGYRFGRLVAGVDVALVLSIAVTLFVLSLFAAAACADPSRGRRGDSGSRGRA